ncbi:MAG TPA: hypothetical protein VGQ96_04140, partial [Candidatus Eremiobacteraceae bacterium]|nr:hypothetical protein [Candidatus Eremiobacteraceae bacterium]
PRNTGWFTPDEKDAIDKLVARTRPYSTLDRARLEAEQLAWVIKPNDAHGGENVLLGWECDRAEWLAALDAAERGDYVMQERVSPTFGTYPVFDADAAQHGATLRTLIEDCNAYVFRGSLGGVLTRLSDEAVINVSRGGQAIPTFVLSPLS